MRDVRPDAGGEVQHNVLTLNFGSTSVKAARFRGDPESVRIPSARARVAIPPADQGDDHSADRWLAGLVDRLPVDIDRPQSVAHRVVHGGGRTVPVTVTDVVINELSALASLAPLHQGPALRLINAARRRWPDVRHIAVFDTSWHATLTSLARRLPLPATLHAAGVMRYGFHGLAFASVMRQLAVLAPPVARARLVLAHLGGGSSLCAVADGRSVDTTMGMTPLDGVPMGTRCGALDPSVILYMAQVLGMTLPQIEHMLWHDSGLRGLSGGSGDMRELLADTGEPAVLAREQYTLRVAQAIVAMGTSLGGVDAVVFSGGIGEGAALIRAQIADRLRWMGLQLDSVANESGATQVHAATSAVAAFVIRADEECELAMAALQSQSA